MKRRRWLMIFGIVLLFFAGCKKEPESTVWEGDLLVYYLDENETALKEEWYVTKKNTGSEQVEELLGKMRTPLKEEYLAAIPDTVGTPEVFMGANGLVTLMFDESYDTVSGVREVLMRAAIVKTLCQAEKVDSVEFYVAGQPLMNGQNMSVGIMKETDFIDSTGPETNYYQYLYATVYYANREGTALCASNLKIPYTDSESEEEIVLRQLIDGPITETMYPVLEQDTKILSVSTKDNVCTVDFSNDFLNKLPDVTEEVVIYSVVNTLAELPGVYQVQFLVEGKQEKTYQKMDLSVPYERNLNIIEQE